VLGCTLFAAVRLKRGHHRHGRQDHHKRELQAVATTAPVAGLACRAGSLGLLIPPSIVMIVYGILAEVSISRLFAAGVLPGLMIAGLYSSWIIFGPCCAPMSALPPEERYPWRDRLWAWPICCLF
jgi:C4-dicarboxylate transporter, DctM subunit